MLRFTIKYIRFIVFFSFLMNSFFGYVYMNITIAGIPINEILLVTGLLFCSPLMPIVLSKFPVIKPILFWSILFVPFVLWGITKYGMWALRDASQLIEVWWIPLSIVAFYQIKENDLKKYLNLFVILAIGKIIIQFIGLAGLFIIRGLHRDLDLFESSSTGMVFIANILFWGYVTGIHKHLIVIPIYVLGIVLGQSRSGIFSIILMSLVYLFITKVKLNLILKMSSFIFILVLAYSLLINIPQLSEHAKFKKLLTFEEYYELMLSTTGESDTFEGSAAGVEQRKSWENEIFKKANESISVLFTGQGFGMELTDLIGEEGNPVREPHNSYLSVFARSGIFGLIIWLAFHLSLNYKIIGFLYRNSELIKQNFKVKYLFVCYLSLINMYVIALTQPGFENPYWAVPAFIVIGGIIFIHKKAINDLRYAQIQNINSHSIIQSRSIYRGGY